MRFTVSRRSEERIRRLVDRFDREDQPIAETWRRVGDESARLGLPRPSYANVRRLALAERRRNADTKAVLDDALATVVAGRVPSLPATVERLREATAPRPVEARVSETQGFEGDG
jgi:hypothetical protein